VFIEMIPLTIGVGHFSTSLTDNRWQVIELVNG